MRQYSRWRVCPQCGARLDPQEKCDCEKVDARDGEEAG